MFKRFRVYLKHFYAPDDKMVRQLALESWREYIVGKPRIYDMDFCLAYQKAFNSQFRHNYAMIQLKSLK